MGSSYFYLEFLLSIISLLRSHPSRKFTNPAIFALEYTLVPDACYPVQLQETVAGYQYILSKVHGDASKICVSGDSAGATLILSLLLHLADQHDHKKSKDLLKTTIPDGKSSTFQRRLPNPALALLLSPWTTLSPPTLYPTPSDYLSPARLAQYASQYSGPQHPVSSPSVSPGACVDKAKWSHAAPTKGIVVLCGQEEVFEPQIREMEKMWRAAGVDTVVEAKERAVHAWVVAALFLSGTGSGRREGVERCVDAICRRMVEWRRDRGRRSQ